MWELDGKQIKELREAIQNIFPLEVEFKRFLREELNLRWDVNTSDKYSEKIGAIIDDFESQGIQKFQKLVISIAKENSNNLSIKNFVYDNISDLIDIDNIEYLPNKKLVELINILEETRGFSNVWTIGKSILPNSVNYPEKFKYLENLDISNWFKCFILLKVLLEDYPLLSECPSIFIFVENLLQKIEPNTGTERDLRDWLQNVSPSFGSRSVQQNSINTVQASRGELKAHLLITVNSEQSKFRVVASLLCIAPTMQEKRIPINLDSNSNERGVLCTKKKLSKILREFIEICISDNLKDSRNLLGCTHYKMIVELFLPISLLYEPIDREMIFGDETFATKYPFVIRSYDHFSKSVIDGKDLWNEFSRSWQYAMDVLREGNTTLNLQDVILHLADPNEVTRSFKEILKNKSIGITSSCLLPNCSKNRYKLMLGILETGIPIMFLPRNNEPSPSEVIKEINAEFLTVDLLRDRCQLLENVRGQRAVALDHSGTPQRRWLRHLTLIWDDPSRMPPMDVLQTRGTK